MLTENILVEFTSYISKGGKMNTHTLQTIMTSLWVMADLFKIQILFEKQQFIYFNNYLCSHSLHRCHDCKGYT